MSSVLKGVVKRLADVVTSVAAFAPNIAATAFGLITAVAQSVSRVVFIVTDAVSRVATFAEDELTNLADKLDNFSSE